MALGATAAFAQEEEEAAEEEGVWAVTGWARANTGWDFEGESQMGKPDGDWDPTGAETTLTWTKGPWKLAGTASVTSENFGTTYGASGNVTATYTAGDWTISGKLAQAFNFDGQGVWRDNDPTVDTDNDTDFTNDKDSFSYSLDVGRTAQFSAENWKQDANTWGFKGVVQLKLNGTAGDWPIPTYDPTSDDNKVAFFINFWDKKVLFEAGYGDYADAAWTTPGPYELQYESADDEDSALRVQFKFVPGLNFGFAYLPAIGHNGVNAGFADSTPDNTNSDGYPITSGFGSWKAVDAIRATSFGAKYAPEGGPLVVAAGFNLKEDAEKGYFGVSYKILNNLTLYVDTQAQHDGAFGQFDLGEKIVFVDDPDAAKLEIGLTLKENRLIRQSGDTSAKDFEFYASPWIWYEFIDKTARAKLAIDLTKGLGEVNEDHLDWLITTTLGWSLNETVALDPDDIGTGFVIKYKFGTVTDKYEVGKGITGPGTATTNQLYFGFKTSF
jgi:hypothetical protein